MPTACIKCLQQRTERKHGDLRFNCFIILLENRFDQAVSEREDLYLKEKDPRDLSFMQHKPVYSRLLQSMITTRKL